MKQLIVTQGILFKIKMVFTLVVILIILGQCVAIGFMGSKIKKLKHEIKYEQTMNEKGEIDEKADNSSTDFDNIRRKLKRR
jgi:hypothetical protein